MGNVTISTENLPAGYCFQGLAQDWPFLVGLLTAQLEGAVNTFNFGNQTPSAENRDKPWDRLNSDGSPDKRYFYYNGFWVARHPMPPGQTIMFTGAEADIVTHDGGESAAVTQLGGPMWEKVSDLDAKFPVGAGTLESGAVLAPDTDGGEEKHILTKPEMPLHTHGPGTGDFLKSFATSITDKEGTVNQTGSLDYKAALPFQNEGLDQPHNNMPPYYVLFFIRRTARLFYRL